MNWLELEVILLIHKSHPPRLLIVIFKSLNVPTQTSPKLPESAMTAEPDGPTPLPNPSTKFVGASGSLLGIENVVDWSPSAVGENCTTNGKQKSGLITTGNPDDGGRTRNLGLLLVIVPTTRLEVPVLQTYNVDRFVVPTHVSAK